MRLLSKLAVVATTCAIGTIGIAAPATAAEVAPSWFGSTHVTIDGGSTYGGWVDGNGPDSYMAWADCNDGSVATGVEHWAGDRNGSFAHCDTGTAAGSSHKGFFLFDN